MKRFYYFALTLCLLVSARVLAQEPGDSRPLADRTSSKAKTELRREKKILHAERRHDQKLQTYAVKHHRDRTKGKITIIPDKWKKKMKRNKKDKKDKGRSATAGEKPKM